MTSPQKCSPRLPPTFRTKNRRPIAGKTYINFLRYDNDHINQRVTLYRGRRDRTIVISETDHGGV